MVCIRRRPQGVGRPPLIGERVRGGLVWGVSRLTRLELAVIGLDSVVEVTRSEISSTGSTTAPYLKVLVRSTISAEERPSTHNLTTANPT